MSGPSNHPNAAYPTWLPRPAVPLTVVAGPIGNGAIDWIRARATSGDVLIEIGLIIAELAGVPAADAPGGWIIPAMQRRNEALAALANASGHAAWLVSQSPMAWQRRFWENLGALVVLLDPGKDAAIAAARAQRLPEKFVHQWYAEAEGSIDRAAPAPRGTPPALGADGRESASKRGYGSQHRVLRDKQLAREPWCRFCWEERQQRVRASVLDHVLAFRNDDGTMNFKLWGDPKNHRSLCQPCHDARGATRRRSEKPPGAAADGRPLDPAHPWNRER